MNYFVPDTLVANDAIKTRHISENSITNKHIAGWKFEYY